MKKVTVIIPCYNEEQGIAEVLNNFPREKLSAHGYELTVLVVDNNCTDKTADIARALGALVLYEPARGKGRALLRAFGSIPDDADYVVMLDGDATYKSEEILRMLEPLSSNFASVVVGSRLGGRIREGSMSALNRLGNWFFSHLVRYFYRVNVTDVLTGYFAWKRESLMRLCPHLRSSGFAIEMEMITKMAHLGEDICSVPISYFPRKGNSSLRPFYDGARIFFMFVKNMWWHPDAPHRIVFVSDAVMPFFHGGKERRLYEISRRLVKEGREVHIYTMQWWHGSKTMMQDGVYFHALCAHYPLYVGSRRSIKQALIFALAVFKLLFVRFDVIDVDHIPYFPVISARLVTWARGKKLYVSWHEVWSKDYWKEYMGPIGTIGYLIERAVLRLPTVIISNSEHTTRALRAAARTNVHTVPLGVDLKHIYDAAPSPVRSDVIYIGRLLPHKNVDLLIGAIALVKQTLPDVLCTIVGDGPEKPRLVRLISELKLERHVAILDLIPKSADLYGLMKSSKMLVLPSVREGFGLVAIEANAAGLPVITTSHKDNAAKDLIREGINGFLAEPTTESIAQKILQVDEMRTHMQPLQEIERHDWREVTSHIEKAFT